MKKLGFTLFLSICLAYSVDVVSCSKQMIEDILPSYVKKVELFNEKFLKITFKEYSPLSWHGDWSKPKEQVIELESSYIFERNIADKKIGYSIKYTFEKICGGKIIIKQETNINANIGKEIEYYAIAIPVVQTAHYKRTKKQ